MDSQPETASSNLKALETLRDSLLSSEDFWAISAIGHLSDITLTLIGMHTTAWTHKHAYMHRTKTDACTHAPIKTTRSPSSQPTHKLVSLQRIQSHREIWPYRSNWIAVIPCLTCFGDVWVGLGDIMPSWAWLLMQKLYERDLSYHFGPLPSGLEMESNLWVRRCKRQWEKYGPVF